ncbi:helix-turn-helix domain-containing protein [Kitasatospora sp. NPDC057015]|uniref:transcriptional regulator n=1 Tax=Kitasatospora sp. NPDC057015 TaxID=3346001 RepID=UPI00363B032D
MSSQDEVEEFAALLRRLKGRTDRSYAALARRLNMSTSTLHRYCTGEAVPLGFAPVERFAVMCRASPAERIELHRRWVLAVAARQRSRAVTRSVPEVAGPDSAGSGSHRAEGAAGFAPASAAASASDSASATAADSAPAAATGLPPGPGGSAATNPGSSPVHDAASGPASGSPPRPASGRNWYRRRAVVTATVVTALVAVLGSLSSSAAGGDRLSGTTAAKTPGARPGSPAVSASAGGDRSSSPAVHPSGAAAPAVTPLAWTVNSQLWEVGCDHDYVIDKAPEQVPRPPAPQDATPWARNQGAVHGGQTLVEISVQGRTDEAVVLEALRVRVVERAAPVKGTVYATGQGCGGDLDPRTFAVNLDLDRPIARSVQGTEGAPGTPAARMPYRVSSKDPEVLLVDARTVACDCRWYLELDWSSLGRTGTERIDDHGLPFRTSGTKDLPHYWYGDHGWAPLTS